MWRPCRSGSATAGNLAPAMTACALAFISHRPALVHELAVMESVVDAVIDQLGDERIAVVRLEIGQLAGVELDALRFCFEVCTQGTTLAGASLEIRTVPALARCRACGGESALASLASPCTCGSFDRDLLAGNELLLKEVEVL